MATGGSEKWETLYAASQEIDFDDDLRKAATVSFKDTEGNDRQSLFFLCADGKAQVLMAGCQNWKAESPGATVCMFTMLTMLGLHAQPCCCLATFGTTSGIDGNCIGVVAIGAYIGPLEVIGGCLIMASMGLSVSCCVA